MRRAELVEKMKGQQQHESCGKKGSYRPGLGMQVILDHGSWGDPKLLVQPAQDKTRQHCT